MRGYRRGRKSVKQEKINAIKMNGMKKIIEIHENPNNKIVYEEKG